MKKQGKDISIFVENIHIQACKKLRDVNIKIRSICREFGLPKSWDSENTIEMEMETNTMK